MAVSSVFPPSASPTEGADLCETDVTNVAIHSVTLLISLCGLAGNGAVLWLLRGTHPAGIFGLAVADFIFLLFALPSALLFLLEDVSCSPIMSPGYVRFLSVLSVISCYWTLFWLTAISTKKDLKKLCKLCCPCDLPDCMMGVVVSSVQFLAFVALITAVLTVASWCPSHKQEHCRVALTSMFAVTLLIFAAPVLITRTIDIVKAKCGSQQQQPKRRDIVIVLVVLLAVLFSLLNFLQQLGYVSSQAFYLLACIHSTIKPFIYFSAGRCWSPCSVGSLRLSLQRVFEEQKDKTAAARIPTGTRGSEPVDPFPCAAEGPRDSD